MKNVIDQSALVDGERKLSYWGEEEVKFLFEGFEGDSARESSFALVVFGGAVTNRKRRGGKGPFFAGVRVSEELGMPLVSVSDPSLELSDTIGLAWYVGNQKIRRLPEFIAETLDAISKVSGKKLILAGGSGGGFACLLISSLMEHEANVVVWNPQTSIPEYVPGVVKNYLETAFPSSREKISKEWRYKKKRKQIVFDVLRDEDVSHSIKIESLNSKKVIYFQNLSDWHVEKHCGKLMSEVKMKRGGKERLIADGVSLYLGDWGNGHAPIPRELLKGVIRKIVRHDGDVGFNLRHKNLISSQVPLFALDEVSGDVSVSCSGGTIISFLSLSHPKLSTFPGVKYAFYFILNGKLLEKRWYSNNSKASFDIKGRSGSVRIVGFAKDCFGKKLRFSNEFSI
ncbi:hypothetical protein [Halomonas elongata]|uniref:hypothetical protein n=1 Tax=Halomonas elongata TaxID=2746 RepID=UPI00186B99C4|nr:hypothetical protein [Halomonas elongata]MBW5798987.1 hypothetical protein [Halomonas elongata]